MRRHIALPIAFVAALTLAGPASASSAIVTTRMSHAGSALIVTVVGLRPTTGAWRVDVSGTGSAANRRISVEINSSDVQFTGRIIGAHWQGQRWVTDRAVSLAWMLGRTGAAVAYRDPVLGMTVASPSIRTPEHGNRTLVVTFRLDPGARRLAVSGGVRLAGEAFLFGPWVMTPAHLV